MKRGSDNGAGGPCVRDTGDADMIREDREWLGPDIPITDHAEAFAIFLERAALRARSGEAVSEIADDILLPIRIAARRI